MIHLGRRNFITGLGLGAGASLLAPLVRGLLPEALGAAALPKRFIVFTHGCGWLEASYACKARSETDFDLGPTYAALAPFKSDLVIVSKLYNPHTNFGGLHGNGWGTLAVTPVSAVDTLHPGDDCCGEHYTPGSVTLDRFVSKQPGFSDARLPITAVGPVWAGGPLVPSGDGPGKPTPALGSPVAAYDAYFGALVKPGATGPGVEALLAQERSVLDFMRADIGRMNTRLAAPERARMDQMLEGLRGVERQLGALVSTTACQAPAKPAPADMKAELAAFVDVVFAAQLCNLTRVSHISLWGVDGPQITYPWLAMPTNEHDTHHMFEADGNAGKLNPAIERVDTFILSKVAQMIGNLAKIPGGNGTMLDDSLVMYVNAAGGKHHQGHNNHAVLLAGRAGGLRTGRYVSVPAMKHAISDLYVSIANLLGAPITTFGDAAICKGPLPGLV